VKLDYVSIEKRVGVAIVRFDRKTNLNAFNEKLVVELTHAAHSFFDDLETHVVVLAGAPNAIVICSIDSQALHSRTPP
jgi:enoyl-CoA hydratase/carnithine racemase